MLTDAGLSEREINALTVLSRKSNIKASELAKELDTTRLDAYNSLERLQRIGLVTTTADRPMRFSSPPLDSAVTHLIEIRKEQLKRIEQGLEDIQSGSKYSTPVEKNSPDDEPKFAVLKERVHIMKRIEKMAESSQDEIVLTLGKFGILHLCRSSALQAVNEAASRGVKVRVLSQLERRTIRFYNDLHESIETRHSDDLDAQGALVDDFEVVQYLSMEENPVGRGKNDAALTVESESFAESQKNLLDTIWEEAIPYEVASKRFTEERIVDPLKLTIDSGSFLEKIREVLQISDDIPEGDTPFNPDAFLASGLEISDARRNLESGGIEALSAFGIDVRHLLRQVGNRVGQELSFSLRNIDGNIEFLSEMMDWWEYAGLGQLSYDIDPQFHILVDHPSVKPGSLPIQSLDDGIIEGALLSRYSDDPTVEITRTTIENSENSVKYEINFNS
ncbi:MAG: TrmB family transcriptional regulator [Candidatus Thalassarchaeaceae archaeon]